MVSTCDSHNSRTDSSITIHLIDIPSSLRHSNRLFLTRESSECLRLVDKFIESSSRRTEKAYFNSSSFFRREVLSTTHNSSRIEKVLYSAFQRLPVGLITSTDSFLSEALYGRLLRSTGLWEHSHVI